LRTISPPAGSGLAAQARALRERLIVLARDRSLRDPLSAACEVTGLSPAQIHTLLWLGRDGALAMGDLARRVRVTEKTATGLVDRLERDGLVHRERDVRDRRVVHVRLTARGTAHHRRIEAGLHEGMTRFLGLLEPADRRAVFRIVERLIARLGRKAPPGTRVP